MPSHLMPPILHSENLVRAFESDSSDPQQLKQIISEWKQSGAQGAPLSLVKGKLQ